MRSKEKQMCCVRFSYLAWLSSHPLTNKVNSNMGWCCNMESIPVTLVGWLYLVNEGSVILGDYGMKVIAKSYNASSG